MGAEASTVGDTGFANGSKHLAKGIPWVARSKLIAKWRKRQRSTQLFAVARHVERADGLYATVQGGERWTQTEDFKQWPLDPPISDNGLEEAKLLGQKLRSVAEETGAAIPVIICSPYFRCVQTAVEICRVLGPQVRMLIDRELGEVFGPAIMGHQQPVFPVRRIEDTRAYCASRGVKCHSKLIGKWPAWGEDLKSARHRYANRFLTYLQRSSVSRRNFVLVTHADCVGAALSMMPSQMDHAVQSVDYGGNFVARRLRRDTAPQAPQGRRKSLPTNFASVVPADSEEMNCNSEDLDTSWDWETQSDPFASPKVSGWIQQGGGSVTDQCCDTEARMDDVAFVDLPHASDGWQVHTQQINLCKKLESTASKDNSSSRFTKRVKTLAKNTSFSKERIASLLGELSEKTLGGEGFSDKNLDRGEEDFDSNSQHRDQRSKTASSLARISFSTFLFGSSDVANMSDCGSSHLSPAPSYRMQDLEKDLEDLKPSQPGSPESPRRHRTWSKRWSKTSASSPRRSDSATSTMDLSLLMQPSPVSINALLEEGLSSGKCNEDSGNSDLSPALGKHTPPFKKMKKKRISWAQDSADAPSDGGARLSFTSDGRESNPSYVSGDLGDCSKQMGQSAKLVNPPFMLDSTKSRHQNHVADQVRSDDTGCAIEACNPCDKVAVAKPLERQPKAADSVIVVDGPQPVGDERKAVPLKDFDSSMLLRRRNKKLAPQDGGIEAKDSADPAGNARVCGGCVTEVCSPIGNAAKIIDGSPDSTGHESQAVPFKSLEGSMLMRRRNMKLNLQTGATKESSSTDNGHKEDDGKCYQRQAE